jgi:hypothetical protein
MRMGKGKGGKERFRHKISPGCVCQVLLTPSLSVLLNNMKKHNPRRCAIWYSFSFSRWLVKQTKQSSAFMILLTNAGWPPNYR